MNFRGSQCHGDSPGVGPGLAGRRFCPGEGRAFPPARRGRAGMVFEPEMALQAAADAGAARCGGSAACRVAAPGQGPAARGSGRGPPAGPTASPRPGHRNLNAAQRAVAAGEGRHVS
jgi:hypothetical protein